MCKSWIWGAGIAAGLLGSTLQAQFATRVVEYHSGVGFATEFGTGLGFTNASSALGAPSQVTPGSFGGPVDPFNPPYLREQLVSLGAPGSLTVELETPATNDPRHPFGLDFLVFGNAGFLITNGNYTGGGLTDGRLLGPFNGSARVSVSEDNVLYYALQGSLAPVFDDYFPTDGQGTFQKPVDPALSPLDFSGQDLAGIRSLYAGSGGGTGFDLSTAVDAHGQPAHLSAVRFVRFEVFAGHAEIDAIAVVPEPSIGQLGLLGAGLFWLRRLSWLSLRHV